MMRLTDAHWQALRPRLRDLAPRLTDHDLAACEQRSDLLMAKIQNRQWISRREAQSLVVALLAEIQAVPS